MKHLMCVTMPAVLLAFQAVVFLLPSHDALAQPTLHFNRIEVNWPQVELWFSVDCNGIPNFDVSKFDLHVRENGTPVGNFVVDCGDSKPRCPLSAALVFDASGSMTGIGIFDAKEAGKAFVDAMDPANDEACIIAFSSQVTVLQTMTSSKSLLNAAIDSIFARGGTALIDGAYAGIHELASNGIRPCKAVIVLSDGVDNMSRRRIEEATDFAVSEGIRVYTIGLGVHIDTAMLRDIAMRSGGRFFLCSSSRELVDVYRAIAMLATRDTLDCVIRYTGSCIDGGERIVDLAVRNYCGGSDSASLVFRAPDNIGRYRPLALGLRGSTTVETSAAGAAVDLLDTLSGELFPTLDLLISYDSMLLGAPALSGAGSLLSPFDGSVALMRPGLAHVRLLGPRSVSGAGRLFRLEFPAAAVNDTVCAGVAIAYASFDEGCFIPSLDSSQLCILPCLLSPTVEPSGPVDFCEGDTVSLRTQPGHPRYAWHRNGLPLSDTLSELRTGSGGEYHVLVVDSLGCVAVSAPVELKALSRLSGSAGNGDTIVAKQGDIIPVPIRLRPFIGAGRRVTARITLTWDPSKLELLDAYRMRGSEWPDSSFVRADPGRLDVGMSDTASGAGEDLFTAAFRVNASRVPTPERIVCEASISTGCDGEWRVEHPVILVDGYCEPLLTRISTPAVYNSPNPFSDETAITVENPSGGFCSLLLTDAFGRLLECLYEGETGSRDRTIRFKAGSYPAGTYFLVLRTPDSGAVRGMHILR